MDCNPEAVFDAVTQSRMLTQYQYFPNQLIFFFSALIRPGRFDMQVTVPKPDVKGRTEIINWYLKKIKVDPGVRSASANPEFACYLLHLNSSPVWL